MMTKMHPQKKGFLFFLLLFIAQLTQGQIQKTDSIYDIWNQVYDIAFADDYLYVNTEDGLKALDYSDIKNPEIVASFPSATSFKIKDNYLYSRSNENIEIFDISDRLSPVKVGLINKYNANISNFIIAGDNLICTEYNKNVVFGNTAYLVIHDITDKTSPVFKYTETLGTGGQISEFTTGDYIFVKKIFGTYPQIIRENHVYSIANPSFPMDLGEISYFPSYQDFLGKDTIYTRDDINIYGLNLSNPLQPDTFAVYGYDGMSDGFLSVTRDSIIVSYKETGRVYTKHLNNSVAFAGMFELPEGSLDRKIIKDNCIYYPQPDSASIINLSLSNDNHVDTLTEVMTKNIELDPNDFTIVNVQGEETWELNYLETENTTEAIMPVTNTLNVTPHASKDWLISPQISLSANYQSFSLSFSHILKNYYSDFTEFLKVYVSENYDGIDPETATWTVLPFPWDGEVIDRSYMVLETYTDLSDFAGKDIHVAFKYEKPDFVETYPHEWHIKDIRISGYNAVNIAGSNSWQVRDGLFSFSIPYSWNEYEINEDWIISNAIPLDGSFNYFMSFSHEFTGINDLLGVYVSENYDGSNPGNATWINIDQVKKSGTGSFDFLYSGTINLTAYAGKTIYIGFKIKNTATNNVTWQIKDFKIMKTMGDLPHYPKVFNMNPEYYNMPKITDTKVRGNTAFITQSMVKYFDNNPNPKVIQRIKMLDVTDPKNMTEKANLSFTSNYSRLDYIFQDSLLGVYINADTSTIYRYDENNELIQKGSILNLEARFHYMLNNHALVGISGGLFRIYDISDLDNPTPVFQFSNTYWSNSVTFDYENKHAYLAAYDGWNSIIEKWDISDLGAPEKIGQYTVNKRATSGIHYNNNVFYISFPMSGSSSGGGGGANPYLRITAYEISGTQLVENGSYQVYYPAGVSFNDDYAFMGVRANSSGYETGIHVISLQNPDSLTRKYLLPDDGTLLNVSATNDVICAAYSNTMELYDLNSIPLPPSSFDLISPSGMVSTTDTILKWHPSTDPNKNNPEYEVHVADNSDFNDATLYKTSDTTLSIGNLVHGQRIFWKVLALDEFTDNVVSNQQLSFSLPELNLLAPEGTIAKNDTVLSWNQNIVSNGSALEYDVLFAEDESFTNPDTLNTSDTTIAVSDLLWGQEYFWKVRSRSSQETGSWSTDFKSFTVDIAPGKLVMEKTLNATALGGVTMLNENTIYSPSASEVYRFDGAGNKQYTLQVNGFIKSSTTITPDHRVYIASTDKNLYAFNKNGVSASGWPVALGAELEASVAIDDDHNLYLGTSNGIYQCISSDGEVQWSYNVGAPVKSSSAISGNDTLYVINSSGRIFAFDLNTLDVNDPAPSWILETNHPVSNSPALAGAHIFVTSDDGYLIKIRNNGDSAEVLFERTTNGTCHSSPVIDATMNVYFAADSGRVYSINGETGEVNWKSSTYYTRSAPSAITATGCLSGQGSLYIGDTHGVLYSFDTSDGHILWSYRGKEETVNGALLYNENKLYYNAGNQMICIAEPNTSVKKGNENISASSTEWMTFQGNNQRTGNNDNISTTVIETYEVSLSLSSDGGGSVSGSGTYENGEVATLTALAEEGYEFINWTENGSAVSNETSYSFTVTSDRTLVANFNLKSFTISIILDPENSGTVSGSGDYNYGETVTLTAAPNSEFQFANWTENNSVVWYETEYTFQAKENRTLHANFESLVGTVPQLNNQHTFKVYPNPAKDKLHITLDDSNGFSNPDLQLELVSMDGRKLYVDIIDRHLNEITVNLTSLKEGVYFIRLQRAEEPVTTLKVVIGK